MFLLSYAPPQNTCGYSAERLLVNGLEGDFLLGRQQITAGSSADSIWEGALRDASAYIRQNTRAEYRPCPGDCLDEQKIAMYCSTGNAYNVKEMFPGLIAESLNGENPDTDGLAGRINSFLRILLAMNKTTFPDVQKLMERIGGQKQSLSYFSVDEIAADVDGAIEKICGEYARILENKHDLIARVKDMVNRNYRNDLSLNKIAQLFYLTPSYLSRVFKQEMGTNLNSYITAVRMEKAEQLLKATDGKVTDIARMVGYPEPNYFTKVFKKYTGHAPTEAEGYRRSAERRRAKT